MVNFPSDNILLPFFAVFLLVSCPLEARQNVLQSPNTQYVINTWDNTTGLPQNTVFNITTDSAGFLWLVTEEGFVRFDGMNFKIFGETTIPELESTYFVDIETAAGGGIWATSLRDIVRVRGRQYSVFHLGEFTESHVTDIAESADGRLWAGTNTGHLFVIDNDSLGRMDTWDFKSSGTITTIEAHGPLIYVGSIEGLFTINRNSGEIKAVRLFE